MSTRKTEVLFKVSVSSQNMDKFQRCAELASRLKEYGRVAVKVDCLAEPTPHKLPPGGSSWHEYLCWLPALPRVFPHPSLEPFLPMKHIEKNRKLLLAKAGVLEKLGLEASCRTIEPGFWPEEFFQKHPHFRGPRVDHPRRSNKAEFAPCVDLPEVLGMYEWMMRELKRHVPMLSALEITSNDVGSGLCWCAALYSGKQGPAHCEHIDPGVRVQKFLEALQRGAEAAGERIRMTIRGNFWENEDYAILPKLPPDTHLQRRDTGAHTAYIIEHDPVRGIIKPLRVIAAMENFHDESTQMINLCFSAIYNRDGDNEETMERVIRLVEGCIQRPTHGLRSRFDRLYEFCREWGGDKHAEKLFEAFVALDQASSIKEVAHPRAVTHGCGVTIRHITRPLVIKPDLLSPDEEAYFLPYIFNIRENEARMDYADMHGGRGTINPVLQTVRDRLNRVADQLQTITDAPESSWLGRLAISIKLWASILRSALNFSEAQRIRDRNSEILNGEERIPEKVSCYFGEQDYLAWCKVMRDELDNAGEFLALLEAGGEELMIRAEKQEYEDAFYLGPELKESIKKKMRIMREHWRDIGKYIASPHK